MRLENLPAIALSVAPTPIEYFWDLDPMVAVG